MNPFKVKDFIKTADNLYFSVIKAGIEKGRVLSCLRYVNQKGVWKKFDTLSAYAFLQDNYPNYLYDSSLIDAQVHGVFIEKIVEHYQPREHLQLLLKHAAEDDVISDLISLCQLFLENGLDITQIGVTGSLLIGLQHSASDIDLVFYQRNIFHQARHLIPHLITENKLRPLSNKLWRQTFMRRGCELSFDEYLWHEQRKNNKALINGRKFDILLSQLSPVSEYNKPYYKQGKIVLTVKIIDASHGFDYPAKFLIDHLEIRAIICFSATYSGQAQTGEWVEVSGQLEKSEDACQHIIVGSSREARGEYIRVINPNPH